MSAIGPSISVLTTFAHCYGYAQIFNVDLSESSLIFIKVHKKLVADLVDDRILLGFHICLAPVQAAGGRIDTIYSNFMKKERNKRLSKYEEESGAPPAKKQRRSTISTKAKGSKLPSSNTGDTGIDRGSEASTTRPPSAISSFSANHYLMEGSPNPPGLLSHGQSNQSTSDRSQSCGQNDNAFLQSNRDIDYTLPPSYAHGDPNSPITYGPDALASQHSHMLNGQGEHGSQPHQIRLGQGNHAENHQQSSYGEDEQAFLPRLRHATHGGELSSQNYDAPLSSPHPYYTSTAHSQIAPTTPASPASNINNHNPQGPSSAMPQNNGSEYTYHEDFGIVSWDELAVLEGYSLQLRN